MPGFLAHYIAGQAVSNSIAINIREKIKQYERLYNLGTQGPDIFFYYFPGHMRKRSRGIGSEMHQNNLGPFITKMARLAKGFDAEDRDLLFAYTAGLVMHYALDTCAHPYVYARTHQDTATKLKNSADHRVFETAIDIALLKLVSGKKPADYSQWELICAENVHLAMAAKAMSHAIKSVYHREIPPKDVFKAMRHMIGLTKLLRSRRGRRKKWMELIENLSLRQPIFSSMVHAQTVDGSLDYLNEQKTPWQPPWEETDFCTDSFIDRYHQAVESGLQMIQYLYNYVYEDLPKKLLLDKLGNRSLKTGLPCEQL